MTSAAFNTALYPVNASDIQLICLEIDHPDLTEPVRVVNDKEDIVSNGNTFIACAFNITLPQQPQGGLPTGQLTVDNVGRELMQWLEISNGGRGATVTFYIIRKGDPDTVEMSMTLYFTSICATQLTIQGDLSLDDIFNRQAIPLIYRPSVAPGLFG